MGESGAGAARYARQTLRSAVGSRRWWALLANAMVERDEQGADHPTLAAAQAISLAIRALRYMKEHDGGRSGGKRNECVFARGWMREL